MIEQQYDRRTLLKGIGLGTTAGLAGCTAPTLQDGAATPLTEVDVSRVAADPTNVPAPVDWDEPRTHDIALETTEVTAEIEPGVTFDYMTFDGRVPGPMVRVRRDDTIRFELTNPEDSGLPHNIDFHAVYGPGGGSEDTTISPGETAEIEFSAMYPGVHIYHCAVPGMDQHISAGMFDAILVEPKEGLPAVDREFYLGQHELYTDGSLGEEGHHSFDVEAMKNEDPTYVVFNGESYAFTEDGYGPLHAETDERIRLYFANGGPNLTSSWHAIGNVWSELYRSGDLLSEPAQYVETTPVSPGSVSAAEIDTPVPGPIKIVDHALSRAGRRGAMGVIDVDGDQNTDVYDGGESEATETDDGGNRSFGGWLNDVDNYDGVVDETGSNTVSVDVGAQANGGAFGFEPPALEISPGTTVEWEWTGNGSSHDVAHDGGEFASDLTDEAGHTFTHTFEEAGTYKYECTPHSSIGMKGVVLVSD